MNDVMGVMGVMGRCDGLSLCFSANVVGVMGYAPAGARVNAPKPRPCMQHLRARVRAPITPITPITLVKKQRVAAVRPITPTHHTHHIGPAAAGAFAVSREGAPAKVGRNISSLRPNGPGERA